MTDQWLPIKTLPTSDNKEMFVVIGINISGLGSSPYTTDPYCVWKEGDKYVRWPHPFEPTHWCPLPSRENVCKPVNIQFPTTIRKMWSGGEIQQWLDSQGPFYR